MAAPFKTLLETVRHIAFRVLRATLNYQVASPVVLCFVFLPLPPRPLFRPHRAHRGAGRGRAHGRLGGGGKHPPGVVGYTLDFVGMECRIECVHGPASQVPEMFLFQGSRRRGGWYFCSFCVVQNSGILLESVLEDDQTVRFCSSPFSTVHG